MTEKKPGRGSQNDSTESRNTPRRRLLKVLLAGGGVVSTTKVLPDSWQRPMVNAVLLPGHAAMSPMLRFTGLILAFPSARRADNESRNRHLLAKAADFLVEPASAVINLEFDGCCIIINILGPPESNDSSVNITIECLDGPGANGEGDIGDLKGSGITVNGTTVTASTVTEELVIGQIGGVSFEATPGECTPIDGEEEEEEEEAFPIEEEESTPA